ncbi:hypothetical protein [Zunongwangia endophytica]|uniref:Uncharacterized protein n=1 Tax=Zunongwangia endophytica TaxID=1808945 RepID=A0ABV8HFC4_9FLAO|nr:hypothetical protein [Zunongwangia endophytica]MDN3594187.1 hypothetical protein [Zunongwangia endophytica]
MVLEKNTSHKILGGFNIVVNGIFSLLCLSEFYKVGILQETKNYPFGGEGPVPFYYKTADLYSNVTLVYGSIFTILLIIGIWNIKNNKVNEKILFCITCALILIQVLQ